MDNPTTIDIYVWAPPYLRLPYERWEECKSASEQSERTLTSCYPNRVVSWDVFNTTAVDTESLVSNIRQSSFCIVWVPMITPEDMRKSIMEASRTCLREDRAALFLIQCDNGEKARSALNCATIPIEFTSSYSEYETITEIIRNVYKAYTQRDTIVGYTNTVLARVAANIFAGGNGR